MNVSICLCIPVYDNPDTIAQVVRGCLAETQLPLIVVDDGSHRPVEELLIGEPERKARETGRITVLRWPRNRGKGVAIRRAIHEAIARGFTHLLTLDADGQHLPTEIAKLVAEAEANPWALVIGARDLVAAEAPKISSFGRRFSNFWVGQETETALSDSQSGLRVYPLFHVQMMRFWTRRFDFEIEVLVRLLWKGVEVREVPVSVHYPKPQERVSHFDKFRDNVRISLLNTALVSLSLFRSHRSPLRLAVALGLGVLIGCSPFYGLQSVLALAVALVFRLNAALLLLGSQVSIPPLAPFLVWVSLEVGHAVTGLALPASLSFDDARRFFGLWLMGSTIVGGVLGTAVGSLAYVTLRLAGRGRKPGWTGRSRGGVVGNWIIRQITFRGGLNAGRLCLRFIVPYFYLFAPRARRASLEYWTLARPGLSWWRKRLHSFRHLSRFAEILLDRAYQAGNAHPCFEAHSHGFDHIREKIRSREGVILLTAHTGAWELAASYAAKRDTGAFHLLQYGAHEPEEKQSTVHFLNREAQPILTVHALLGRGEPVALMGDRPVGKHYALVPFFGKLAAFDTTAFRVAAACRKPLVFTFGFKATDGAYAFHAEPARTYAFPQGADREALCREWAAEFAACLERFLERYPDQWFNFFPFWSLPPAAPGAENKVLSRPRSRRAARIPTPVEAV